MPKLSYCTKDVFCIAVFMFTPAVTGEIPEASSVVIVISHFSYRTLTDSL